MNSVTELPTIQAINDVSVVLLDELHIELSDVPFQDALLNCRAGQHLDTNNVSICTTR
jgi:hypothetical protein